MNTKVKKTKKYPAKIFSHERTRINKIITRLNNTGKNIPFLKSYKDFRKDITEDKDDIKSYKLYLKYFDETALSLIKDYKECEEEIEEINAEILLDNFRFRSNGFYQYIKSSVWDLDLSKTEDEILNILLFEWYDFSETERKLYRDLGEKRYKLCNTPTNNMRKNNHIIENFIDIDIDWDSDEEWIE